MPSKSEAFGIVFEEAAAAGIPSIGTAINAVPEIIEHDATGLLVPPGDRAALVEALRALAGDVERRIAMGQAARARIRDRAFPPAYASRLGAIIERAMEQSAAAPKA
jgi:glycosyltransferase involved in cell wall biosynthesis